jgi:ribA/ribD-fused uncharacterized protein
MTIDEFRGRWFFLSNFYPCEIEHRGIKYPTVEHYYVAMKIKGPINYKGVQLTEGDAREYVSRLPTPAAAKQFGRSIEIREEWESIKLIAMEWGLRVKFAPSTPLADMLIQTGDEELVEGNNWGDKFWGRVNGDGENQLGRLLMKIRDELNGVE